MLEFYYNSRHTCLFTIFTEPTDNEWGFLFFGLYLFLSLSFFPLASFLIAVQINSICLRHRPLHWCQLFQELAETRLFYVKPIEDTTFNIWFRLVENMFILLSVTVLSWIYYAWNKNKPGIEKYAKIDCDLC